MSNLQMPGKFICYTSNAGYPGEKNAPEYPASYFISYNRCMPRLRPVSAAAVLFIGKMEFIQDVEGQPHQHAHHAGQHHAGEFHIAQF